MASKFHVSPRLFDQILPLQSCTASADVSSAPMGDGEASPRSDRASLSKMPINDARRRPQLFSALSCNGRTWAKSLRLMQNFDDFVMIQETEIPKSI